MIDRRVIGAKPWRDALASPAQRLPYVRVKSRQAVEAVQARWGPLVAGLRRRAPRLALLLLAELVALVLLHLVVVSTATATGGAALSAATLLALTLIPFMALNYVLLLGAFACHRYRVSDQYFNIIIIYNEHLQHKENKKIGKNKKKLQKNKNKFNKNHYLNKLKNKIQKIDKSSYFQNID